jgi:glycosyltransferase involved in cell wall biosynthesis
MMPKKKLLLTVVIPLKNTKEHHRGTKRLRDCLYSLSNQSVPSEQVEIIVADTDSDPYYKTKHKEACDKFKARHIYTKTDDVWNISRARNIGIKNAKADYVMTTDVDCIFAPDFIETVIKHMAEDRIIHCRISDLPGNYDDKLDNFLWMNKVSILRPPFGYGGCQVFSKKWAFKVHGFDEDYIVWGADDTDFYLRATQDGLKSVWIEKEASFFHQYHETEYQRQ